MEYFEYLKKGFEILKLNRSAISDVASDDHATGWSVLTVALTGLVLGFLTALYIWTISPLLGTFGGFTRMGNLPVAYISILWYPIAHLVSLFVGSGVLYLLAKLFGGKGTYMGIVRPWGLASFLNVLSFIPVVNVLVLVWDLVAGVVTLSETQQLSLGKSIGVFVVLFVILGVLSALFAVALLSTFTAFTAK